MREQDHDIGLAVARLAVAQGVGRCVGRCHRVDERDALDAVGGHQGRGLPGHHTDEADRHTTDVKHLGGGEVRFLALDVRAEGRPVREPFAVYAVRGRVGEEVVATVELVVADGRRRQPNRVEHLDGRGVLLHGGDERCRTDVVAGGHEGRRLAGRQRVNRAGQDRGTGYPAALVVHQTTVEVVDREDADGHRCGLGRGCHEPHRQDRGAEGCSG